MKRIATIATLLVGLAAAKPAQAKPDPNLVAGITLGSLGGAAALVADFGALVYISGLENARGWGWLALLSGVPTAIGGGFFIYADYSAGSALIAFGVLSVATGIVGIALPQRDSDRHAYSWMLLPTGNRGAALFWGGRF
ncbi:MAG: hypothetical protein H6707_19810 [Deltaproteobacteria bacterium]|nr:hypothetical protein [Deltaproteobacteria bacterium]